MHSMSLRHLSEMCDTADQEDRIGITDFGIAVLEEELAAELKDRQSMIGQQSPSGGFHKRHLVRLLDANYNISL